MSEAFTRRRDAAKVPDLKYVGKASGKARGKAKRPDMSGKTGKQPPIDWGKMRAHAEKHKGKFGKLGKHGRGKGKVGAAPAGKAGKRGKASGFPDSGKLKEFQSKQFNIMDSNRDGEVSSEELVEVVAALRKRAEDNGIDLAAVEGPLTPTQWKGFEPVESTLLQKTETNNPERNGAAGWFKAADLNGDGKLTLQEFQERLSKNAVKKTSREQEL